MPLLARKSTNVFIADSRELRTNCRCEVPFSRSASALPQTHVKCLVQEGGTGEAVGSSVNTRFYLDFAADTGMLIWAPRRRPTHDELVRAWSAREEAESAEIAAGGRPDGVSPVNRFSPYSVR